MSGGSKLGAGEAMPPAIPDISGNREDLMPAYWNGWMSLGGHAPADPVDTLQPGHDYNLHLVLSPKAVEGLATAQAGHDVRLAMAAAQGSMRFDIILFPDPEFFSDHEAKWTGAIQISAAALQKAKASEAADAYGEATFKLHTHKTIPAGAHLASVAVSIWANGRPIDELKLQSCVVAGGATTQDCPAFNKRALRPDEAPVASATTTTVAPGAAMHIVSVGEGPSWAVFREKGQKLQAAVTWQLPPRKILLHNLSRVLHNFQTSAPEDQPLAGKALFNLLFDDALLNAHAAQAKLQHYVSKSHSRKHLLVRLIPAGLLPIGLMVLDDGTYLADRVTLEMPLPLPAPPAVHPMECQEWVTLLPAPEEAGSLKTSDGTLLTARNRLEAESDDEALPALLRRFLDDWRIGTTKGGYSLISDFAKWILQRTPSPRTGLVIMSHHSDDALSFGEGTKITADSFARTFQPQSFALLNACGTGNVTATTMISHLNKKGFSSIVATALEVKALMAADFLRCFARVADDQKGASATIGSIFDQSLECMKPDYPVLRHSYMLLGDRDTPVCPTAAH